MTSLDLVSAAAAGALSVVLLALPSYAQSLKEPAMTRVAVAPPIAAEDQAIRPFQINVPDSARWRICAAASRPPAGPTGRRCAIDPKACS